MSMASPMILLTLITLIYRITLTFGPGKCKSRLACVSPVLLHAIGCPHCIGSFLSIGDRIGDCLLGVLTATFVLSNFSVTLTAVCESTGIFAVALICCLPLAFVAKFVVDGGTAIRECASGTR